MRRVTAGTLRHRSSRHLAAQQPRLGGLELFIGQQTSLLHLPQLLQLAHHVAPARCRSGRRRCHRGRVLHLLRLQGRNLRLQVRYILLGLEGGLLRHRFLLLRHRFLFLRRILLILTVRHPAADRGGGAGHHRRRRRRPDQSTSPPRCRSEHSRLLPSRNDSPLRPYAAAASATISWTIARGIRSLTITSPFAFATASTNRVAQTFSNSSRAAELLGSSAFAISRPSS